jgi:hypothetical protein
MKPSYEELLALAWQIRDDGDQIEATGIRLRSWGPNREKTAVAMEVQTDSATAQRYMDATYGPGRVIVTHTDQPRPTRCAGSFTSDRSARPLR